MAITYHGAYKHKKLNEVVMLGSHDAGIDKGNANTRTQNGGILQQAQAGARFFDVRIAAFNNPTGSASLRAYHDETKIAVGHAKHLKTGPDTTREEGRIKVHATMLGAKGLGLHQMLGEARQFVESGEGRTEFLMLKFDKSTNWPLIAKACMDTLGDTIYRLPEGTCLNEQTLDDLKGSVIVLFDRDGWQECGVAPDQRRRKGILQWKNLYKSDQGSPGTFALDFPGLQYYGKGGVSRSAKGDSGKIARNAEIQAALARGQGTFKEKSGGLRVGGKRFFQRTTKGTHDGVDPRVVGLMYWTTTGISRRGIEARNNKMWSADNQRLLVEATELAVELLPSSVDPSSGSGATVAKRFMPNIIMVDFVNTHQGKLVRELNTRSAAQIRTVIEQGLQV